jgi:hypothetical protein
MLHTETQMSIPQQSHQACTSLYTVAQSSRATLIQPRSNRETQGDHPPPCSTMDYGQVQKKRWTQLSDVREVVERSVTRLDANPTNRTTGQASPVPS